MRRPRAHLYQPQLWEFVGFPTRSREQTPSVTFFLSFEDALWTLCRHLGLGRGRRFLVPSLYCMEVVDALRQRGFSVEHYALDADLQADVGEIERRVAACPSALVIVYHPFGMLSNLCRATAWEALLGPEGGIIEDCAHRLLLGSHECRVGARRFVLDSLRKVTSLQGSRLLSTPQHAAGLQRCVGRRTAAGLATIARYRLWRTVLFAADRLGSDRLWRRAEVQFEGYNERIGTLEPPQLGPLLDRAAVPWLSPATVAQHKEALARVYREALVPLAARWPFVQQIAVAEEELGRLKSYPVAVDRHRVSPLLGVLEERRVHLDAVFPDSPHCATRHILALPLGPHMNAADAARLVDVLGQACALVAGTAHSAAKVTP